MLKCADWSGHAPSTVPVPRAVWLKLAVMMMMVSKNLSCCSRHDWNKAAEPRGSRCRDVANTYKKVFYFNWTCLKIFIERKWNYIHSPALVSKVLTLQIFHFWLQLRGVSFILDRLSTTPYKAREVSITWTFSDSALFSISQVTNHSRDRWLITAGPEVLYQWSTWGKSCIL